MMQKEGFNKFAELLEYPLEGYEKLVASHSKEFGFLDFAEEHSLHTLQELYIRTFEVEPLCNLYIGVHIFGEDGFKRGSFMAKLKEAYLKYGVDESDVVDFLPCILRLATRLDDEDKYNSLIEECILRPLGTILESFNEESNPYKKVLLALNEFAKSANMKGVK